MLLCVYIFVSIGSAYFFRDDSSVQQPMFQMQLWFDACVLTHKMSILVLKKIHIITEIFGIPEP